MEVQNFFQDDYLASRIIRQAFARQRLKMMMSVVGRMGFMRRKACFLCLIAMSRSFVHHRTDGLCQGFVFGIASEAASNILVSKG